MTLVQNDDVGETVTANRANDSLDEGILPARTLERTDSLIFECWPQSPRKDLIFALLQRAGFSISPLDVTNYWAYKEGL